jgi:heterodisulfide reductase subunit C2
MTETATSSGKEPIQIDELNQNFKNEVTKISGGENIKRCFACGTCSVICPVFAVEERYDPRKIIRMMILGMEDEVLQSELIWLCSGCYSCYELCPRDVKLTNVMSAIRQIAVTRGFLPPGMKATVEQLEKFGRLTEVSEFENKVRTKKDIPELKEDIPEIIALIKKMGTRKAIEGGSSDE